MFHTFVVSTPENPEHMFNTHFLPELQFPMNLLKRREVYKEITWINKLIEISLQRRLLTTHAIHLLTIKFVPIFMEWRRSGKWRWCGENQEGRVLYRTSLILVLFPSEGSLCPKYGLSTIVYSLLYISTASFNS